MAEDGARPFERLFLGVLSVLMATGIGWTAYTQTQLLQRQAEQGVRSEAVIFRLGLLEARLGTDYFYPRGAAEKTHEAMQGNINHNWEVIQRLDVRMRALERHSWAEAHSRRSAGAASGD